MSQYAYVTLN